ncbi:MAG: type I-C CRISPR-associated protein Cas8c/Csd1 [Firmicutes bacterium]|nr:type I-C CRISPR-associated protein Cas8c/Csd1 [Bacillota bacterium]
MILQALTAYYEDLARTGKIARQGWGKSRISYALELGEGGEVCRVIPLETADERGKSRPREMELPAPVKRTVGVASNFLWDNGSYLLGHAKDAAKDSRAGKCFAAAKELHCSLLSGSEDPFAQAICRFFENYDPALGSTDPVLAGEWENLISGCNLTFAYGNQYPGDNEALARAWESHYGQDAEGEKLRCLITGEPAVPEKTHPAIKRLYGAQSSGAALVSFNAPAFCSYGREQNENAPVGQYGAFAYTAALNYLLSDRRHYRRIGGDTYVFWAEGAEEQYEDAFGAFLDGNSDTVKDEDLASVLDALAGKKLCNWDNLPLNPENRFYVLGLAPNAARISVRFFLQDTFGVFAQRLKAHYDRLEIIRPSFDNRTQLPLWLLLQETVNRQSRDKTASPQMSADTLRAILTGGRYPATLFQQTMLRIRAEHDITRGKAAIIKAYLLRNDTQQNRMEALTVKLNDDCNDLPYVLGRLFSVLEDIQQQANPGINTTIKDRYFSSASATPAVVFPVLLNLAEKHQKKLSAGQKVYNSKRLQDLMGRIRESYPTHLTLSDQGIFQLGYYHETQKRYSGSKAGQE